MKNLCVGFVLALSLAAFGCGKKDEASSSKSGLPWTPEGYDKMSATCKKALACCEEIAKSEGAKSAEDYNGKCSGPAMWKDGECDLDLKSRITVLEGASKPVPSACK